MTRYLSPATAHRVLSAAAARADMPPHMLIERNRDWPRLYYAACAAAALRRLGYSLPQIGRVMKRDHTTVLNALRRVDPDDPVIDALVKSSQEANQ